MAAAPPASKAANPSADPRRRVLIVASPFVLHPFDASRGWRIHARFPAAIVADYRLQPSAPRRQVDSPSPRGGQTDSRGSMQKYSASDDGKVVGGKIVVFLNPLREQPVRSPDEPL